MIGKVHRRNDDREGERKRRHEPDAAEHQPGLVAVPDRRHRVHHQPAPLRAHEAGQNADAEVEAVEHDVIEHREPENQRPDRNEIEDHGGAPVAGAGGASGSVGMAEAAVAVVGVAAPAKARTGRLASASSSSPARSSTPRRTIDRHEGDAGQEHDEIDDDIERKRDRDVGSGQRRRYRIPRCAAGRTPSTAGVRPRSSPSRRSPRRSRAAPPPGIRGETSASGSAARRAA